ncbi:FAD-dependent oxidoreductase [Clostridium sp. Marseille-QA1073]
MININKSLWLDTTKTTNYEKLNGNFEIDIAIIGGGLAGISTAYMLKKSGFNVAVFEGNRIGENTTGNTTAKITSQHDLIYDKLINDFGKEKARQYADANQSAIKKIKEIIEENNIDCDFEEKIACVYTESEKYIDKIEREVKAAESLGISAEFAKKVALPFDIKAGVVFHNQAQFHPRKYLLALAEKVNGDGSYIFEHTRILDVDKEDKKLILSTKDEKITANKVIVATHFPILNSHGLYFVRMHGERSYVLGLDTKNINVDGMYISAEKPKRSFRTQKLGDRDVLLLGGESHRTGEFYNTEKCYEALKKYGEKLYESMEIIYKWSTQDMTPLDGVPYIGQYSANTENLYVATGFQKWGMTSSTVAAMIITDLISTGKSPWIDVYTPSRFNVASSIKELGGNASKFTQRYTKGKLDYPEKSIKNVGKGEGKVVEYEGRKIGVYRDEQGNYYGVEIICTHMQCELQWNNSEKSWDCPCHASRFTIKGEIIEGPTVKPLRVVDIDKEKIKNNG